jgi:RNA-splicing ligase RtcB
LKNGSHLDRREAESLFEAIGKYASAKIYTDNLDESSLSQIYSLLNHETASGSCVRFMPDAHAGKGCVIGATMTLSGKVVPSFVGFDIGCGMETVLIKERWVELQKLDKVIRETIPSGFDTRKSKHKFTGEIDLKSLVCLKHVHLQRAELSMGTLGGGNHFIELGKDGEGALYLVIHSGSRTLGGQVAKHYQDLAYSLAREGQGSHAVHWMPWLEGKHFDNYINDMMVAQSYAKLNRKAIAHDIIKAMKLTPVDSFTTVHNYIDTDANPMILRKGAISAKDSERVIIPMNMRDGSIICIGRGNPDWNMSAPHGAGRLMTRADAKQSISLSQFKEAMKGIYTTSAKKATIDESPFAYKPMEEIVGNIGDSVSIEKIVKPLYNYKASA